MDFRHLPPVILLLFSYFLHAQNFTDLHSGFPTLGGASAAWGDYDHDGDPDLALIGFSGQVAEVGSIYRNDGNGEFTLVFSLSIPVSSGSVSWGDFDHDEDLDLLVTGQRGNGGPPSNTTLYRNDSNDLFTPVFSGLADIIGTARWIDYDRDGWLDVVMCGIGNSFIEDSTKLFHNDTTGTFTEVPANLPGYLATDITIVDYDNDQDQDFFVVGGTLSSSTFPASRLFRNDGNAVFTQVPFHFIDLSTGTSAWADYDHDGDMDLLYDGIDSTLVHNVTALYRNDGLDQFTRMDADLPGSGEPGSVDWADIDNDDDLDILLGGPTTLLRNDSANAYTDVSPVDFLYGIPNSFADIDNDGDQDILIISSSGGFASSTIFRNDFSTSVDNISESISMLLYPNPTYEIFQLHSINDFDGSLILTITDAAGVIFYNQKITISRTKELSVSLPSILPGLYFYTLQQDGQRINSGKFVHIR